LATQQQQNLLLRKQSEIDKLQSEANKRLFEQHLAAEKEKEKGIPRFDSHSFESIIVEPSSPDTPPSSQNRPRLFHKQSVVVAQPVVQKVSSSEMLDIMTSHSSVSQATGLDLGVATATGKLPGCAQAAACCGPDTLGTPSSMADIGVSHAVYSQGSQPKPPAYLPEQYCGITVSNQPIGNFVTPPSMTSHGLA